MLPLISKKNRKILTEIVLVGMTVIFLSSCESRFIPFAKPKATKSVVEGSGNINVTSNPSYASVYLDGSYEGYTPITIYGVEVGEHQVKVTYTGYSNYITTCTVWNGQTAYVTANLGGTAPTGLTATAGNGQVTLTWNSVSNAYYYKIYRSNSATGTYSYIGTAYSTSYTNTGLTNGQTYYYKVSAVDYSYNESALSSYVSATPTSTAISGDSYEDDDSFTQYTSISPATYSQSQSRSIQPGGDYDYIRFYANSGKTYVFYTTGTTDTYATLYNSTQGYVTSDDDSYDATNFKISWYCASSGYYYLVIKGYYSSTTGNYTFYYYYY